MSFVVYNYYATFVPQYAYIATLLYNILLKNINFYQTTDLNTAFKHLKSALVYALVLAMPNFNANSIVETDASYLAIGVMLMQHDWAVVLISTVLNSAQYNYHNMDHELFAILLACKKWHLYLHSKKIVILSDHICLIGIYLTPNLKKDKSGGLKLLIIPQSSWFISQGLGGLSSMHCLAHFHI